MAGGNGKIPNPNDQIPNKSQITKSKLQKMPAERGAWWHLARENRAHNLVHSFRGQDAGM